MPQPTQQQLDNRQAAITSTTLQQPPVNQYQAPAPTTPYPVQTLVTDPFAQTQPEGQANDLSTQLAGLNQQLVGESAFRTQQNDQLGVNSATSAVNDLSAQLMGLANQSTALQNSAAYTIPNQQQENVRTGGAIVTAGGLAPLTAAELRKNQIQQGAIATQALTVKSALEAAQGRLANAQYLADQAVKAKFDPVREEIAAKQANLQLIQSSPAYTEAQKKRAFAQQQLLDQQKRTLDQQTEDYKTAQAMAAAAVKNNPNNPQATLAVQQAMKLDQNDPQYLQKIFSYLGQFQVDPNATKAALLDLELKRAQINQIPLDNAYKRAQIGSINLQNQLTRKQIDAMNKGGTILTAQGKPLDATQAQSLGYAQRMQQSALTIDKLGSQFTGAQSVFNNSIPNVMKSGDLQQFDQAKRNFITAVLRKESGAAISDSEYASYDKLYFPQAGDSPATVAQKKQTRDLAINSMLTQAGNPNIATQAPNTTKSGQTFDVAGAKAAGYSDAEIQAYINSH